MAEKKPPTKPEMQEIASIARDPMLVMFNNTLRHEDETLLTRGSAKSYKIYDDLERDAHAGAVLDKRKMAVISRPWEVTAASDDPRDVQASEVVRAAFNHMAFDRLCEDLLDATLKGFAVAEVLWEVRDGLILPFNTVPRQQRRFVFNLQNELRLKTRTSMQDGEQLPERKFIVHTYGGKDGSPYGLGLGSKLFWPVWFKKQGITFWLTFADKFGSPTALGKYPTGATKDEQAKLLKALSAIAQDAGVIVPEGMVIELLEASRSGTIDTYEKLCRYMDEQISKAVLGETMSTTASSAGLGSGQADVQNSVRKELAERDAKMLCATIRRTLATWLVEFNVPGARVPSLERNFDEPEDLTARAERDVKIKTLGFNPTEQYVLETYGEGWEKAVVVPRPLAANGSVGAAQFAEGAVASGRSFNREAQEMMVQAADALASTWNKTMRQRVEDLQAVAEQTGDLAQFRERLADLLSTPPPPELVESLARANFAAHLLGRGRSNAEFAEPASGRLTGFFRRLFNGT